MKSSLIFVTGNRHKVQEVQSLLGGDFALRCLKDLGITEEIPETSATLQGNALQKAQYVYDRMHCACFADDTGLEVEALNGAPGVYSARYAGEPKDDARNVARLLQEMQGVQHRKARFRTVICYLNEAGTPTYFEGIVEGEILTQCVGEEGFGYDPIFRPTGYQESFAQLTMDQKNAISHRGRALRQFTDYLKKL